MEFALQSQSCQVSATRSLLL